MKTGRIYVCNDVGLSLLLDKIASGLEERGHTVVRGPSNEPGERKTFNAEERAEVFEGVDVGFFGARHICSREVLEDAKTLKGVCSPVIGVDSIDRKAAEELGVIIGNGAVRGNVVGMAESTVMLMLMLLYDVQANIEIMKQKLWRRPGHHSNQMEDKVIGLIGFGQIAREISLRLKPFGVKIITHSPRAKEDQLPEGVTKVDLDTLMRDSDVVTVLTDLTPEKYRMINAEKLALMKPSAYLVNTARGAVVDEAALVDALRENRIAGAALDAFEKEPLPHDSGFYDLNNVILTPHAVGHTIECFEQFVPAAIENAERILRGELPLHCKNPNIEPAWRARLQKITGE